MRQPHSPIACNDLILTRPKLHLTTLKCIWQPYCFDPYASTTFNVTYQDLCQSQTVWSLQKEQPHLSYCKCSQSKCLHPNCQQHGEPGKQDMRFTLGKKIRPILRNRRLDGNLLFLCCSKHTLLKSFVKTPDASPYSVPLALFKTPSISLK